MKMTSMLALMAALLLVPMARLGSGEARADEAREYILEIGGMTCATSAAAKLSYALERIEGVERVQITFTMGTATVKMQPGALLSEANLEPAFSHNPYTLESLEQTSP